MYGCRNHGTLQETVMPFVQRFLESRGKVLDLLISDPRDTHGLTSLVRQYQGTSEQIRSIVAAMHTFVHDALSGTGVDFEFFTDDELEENKHVIIDMYEQIYDLSLKELEQRLVSLEDEHTKITSQYFKLPPKAQEKAISCLKELEEKIASTRGELEPLAERWESLLISLGTLRTHPGCIEALSHRPTSSTSGSTAEGHQSDRGLLRAQGSQAFPAEFDSYCTRDR